MTPDELFYWLALLRLDNIGPAHFLAILENYPNLKSYFEKNRFLEVDWKSAEADMKWAESPKHHIITLKDSRYPPRLREISSAPPLLFIEGDVTLLSNPQIAMVGSRHPTAAGADIAYQFAKYFAQNDWMITSGLAMGIDSASHEGCLEANGKTIAVMGTGPDQIYPKRHQALARKISNNGCLVTEFPTGVSAIAKNFPRRNRIISGLSPGVLVVEAAYASGSLITAKYALEQNREIFAIPGSIHNPVSRGCHALIKQGAKLVETAQDVLEELGFSGKHPQTTSLHSHSHPEQKKDSLILNAIDFHATPIDLIIERTGISAEEISSQLLMLELEGHVQSVPGGYVRAK